MDYVDKQSSLPTTDSFRPEVIDQYVRNRILTGNPVTWLSPVIGMLIAGGGFAFMQFFELWMAFSLFGGVALGMGSLGFDAFVRKDAIRMSYLGKVNQALAKQADQTASWLLNEFGVMEHSVGVGLVERLQRHLLTFEDVLDDKFEEGTESYEHFHGVAEALYMQTLNCLKDVVSQMKANAAIDIDYAKKRASKTSGTEQETHRQKLKLHADGTKRVEELLASAETAVAGLAELSHKVAGIKSGSEKDLQNFIGEVHAVADRAGFFVDERSL